jgi:membrane protease YdiL (CAAX protease family)
MIAASLAIFLFLALSFALTEALLPKDLGIPWPNLIGAFACGLGYWVYVKAVERRPVVELAASRAIPEWACGAALGVLIGLLTLAPLWGWGDYRIEGVGNVDPLLRQVPEMALVSAFEELLMRCVVLRIAQQAWGTRSALVLSTLLFVAAHLPGGISFIGALVTAAASLAFSAAYLITGRVWLPMGVHFAWNYLFAAVFSVPVSGHEAKGWLHGSMTGPAWLTGGSYGVEASAVALVVWSVAAAMLLYGALARRGIAPAATQAQPR